MLTHPKYIGIALILLILYLFVTWFQILHYFCLIGGLINILINLSHINPFVIKRLILKSNQESNDKSEFQEPSFSIQFINLCKGFKYGLIGYMLTLGIIPYNFYLMINPEKNSESFKVEILTLYKKFLDLAKN